ADDAVGADVHAGREALAEVVVPDAEYAEPLWGRDLPFEVVADHPGVLGMDAERLHGVAVGALLRLAEAGLALDLHVVEAAGEVEASDLGALCVGRAIGHQGQAQAARPQLVDGLDCAGEAGVLLPQPM